VHSVRNCLQCVHCRRRIASTHGDHTIRISSVRTGKCTHVLDGHPRTPWCVAFHPSNSDILASGCLAGEVRVWDLKVIGLLTPVLLLYANTKLILDEYFVFIHSYFWLITHAGGSQAVGRMIGCVSDFACMFVCLCVRALKQKWLVLSPPISWHKCGHASRLRCLKNEVEWSMSHCYEKGHSCTLPVKCAAAAAGVRLPVM